jgi:DNA primase small subunit
MMKTTMFLKRNFSEYYAKSELVVPERFGRREWGFFFFQGSGMQRHIAFNRLEELREFLTTRTPRHVYYSSAYYQNPELQPMPQKTEGWLGADLIFDLDDEHLSGIEGLSPAQRLDRVKRIVKDKLLDDFLLRDFGFKPENIKVTFSGGRGYHIHIFDPKIQTLESPERREIVDYITAMGFDDKKVIKEKVYDIKEYGGHRTAKTLIENLPSETDSGWQGRFARGVSTLLNNMEKKEKKECLKWLKGMTNEKKPVSDNSIKTFYKDLFEGKIGERKIDTIKNEGNIETLPDKGRDLLVVFAIQQVRIDMAGETDEPVTVDTKRLIRFPGSLHGKTGLKVVPIAIDDLDEFEPLRDAVAFNSDRIMVEIPEGLEFTLGGEGFELESGEQSIPKYAGIYLMCRGQAALS